MNQSVPNNSSPWPHRFAVMLVCATFPLIWVGGLVTTSKAGMAVPDWPSTYGYNLFLYPWQTWIFGPYDLFIEHGHRILGAVVGMIAIGFLASVVLTKAKKSLVVLASIALIAVIIQGLLGGARVIQDEILLAKIHGCFGPAFFMLAVSLEVITSGRWQKMTALTTATENLKAVSTIQRLAVSTAFFAYVQLLLGAQLRHVAPMTHHGDFRVMVIFHVLVAFVVLAHVILLTVNVWRFEQPLPKLRIVSLFASCVVAGQIALGIATWTTKYAWPTFLPGGDSFAAFLIEAESFTQTIIVTAHVATGSLILGIAITAALYSFRYFPSGVQLPRINGNTLRGVVA